MLPIVVVAGAFLATQPVALGAMEAITQESPLSITEIPHL